ncbi:transcriptional regulator with XRE-family HTH domain [Roseinatronobacter monicus]|uniref:Transcriptional regulator with XRE-family HTH domain n=2 Tax=Roseinatronobacter monicus TaxID=393481 RepID=A0A543KHN9_9RHOB|nr:transcriptional regulator with XRE-family HTH domain [Roseinatronobacter monicus]
MITKVYIVRLKKRMNKREASALFRGRLAQLLAQSRMTQSAFAESLGIDRSALSQLLTGPDPRLPRAETLLAIAAQFQVSADWLLGLSEDTGTVTQTLDSVETEAALDSESRTAMERWHQEATGQKMRYVPAHLPDLMRTPEVIAFQAQQSEQERRRLHAQTQRRLRLSRAPEADIEMCMPLQSFEIFAAGCGVWRGLPAAVRQKQLDYIAQTVDELYPSFRMYLFDGRKRFAPPMTLFGYHRAAVYAGEVYLLIRSKRLIRDLAQGFDGHIRAAEVHAHEAADWVRSLRAA